MRISKLRRTLAVFLSMMMITLCVPFTAIRVSAATTYQIISQGIPSTLYTGDTLYNDGMATAYVDIYYAWKDHSNSDYTTWKSDTAVVRES